MEINLELQQCSENNEIETNKCVIRGKKRKKPCSGSSSEEQDAFPDNILEVEKNLQASAMKNNLNETSMKKLIKKVVTNDHVLALVKLKEEELMENDKSLQPKLTRAKAKELMKVSPKTAPWNIELTPIKHIPVKTRPEVKALIAQELPEDEDDEEYKPTQDEVPSDDDQTIESCSDVDSQPRTPATPSTVCTPSPQPIKDGPFKVPQTISSIARRKLDMEEEATIALRTRSKLSLSTTSIEHIESSFNPPDDIPTPVVDDLWSQFLAECLNPGPSLKNEDDDETDPEYSVAADPDAHEEDQEDLENSIIKISKKELNDLMTELFDLVPESTAERITESLLSESTLQNSKNETIWEGKQEPTSDDENQNRDRPRLTFEKDNLIVLSVGKTETVDSDRAENDNVSQAPQKEDVTQVPQKEIINVITVNEMLATPTAENYTKTIEITVDDLQIMKPKPPPSLQTVHEKSADVLTVQTNITANVQILPEQIQILQQQLRQHIQLAASNFLQLFVHPIHWARAPQYKEYLETFHKMHIANPNSVVNVCNLKPAYDLILSWEKSVSENTPENAAMVEFIQKEADRSRRRAASNCLYVGDFHPTFLNTVANSTVFLYPYLLPAVPYRPENTRKAFYLPTEDALIAMGLAQFWDYVEMNPELFKPPTKTHPRQRWGFVPTIELINKYMMPWHSARNISAHIGHIKRNGSDDNPIKRWFTKGELVPVKHQLLSFSPNLTLYEQPASEMPKIWLRHLSKSSKRFKNYLYRRSNGGAPTNGVPVNLDTKINVPIKKPLPIEFTKPIPNAMVKKKKDVTTNRVDVNIETVAEQSPPLNVFRAVPTSTGYILVPVTIQTNTTNSVSTPITSTSETPVKILPKPDTKPADNEHCDCCKLLQKILKYRQTVITEFFKPKHHSPIRCPCQNSARKAPRITNRLRLLVSIHRMGLKLLTSELESKLKKCKYTDPNQKIEEDVEINEKDAEFVLKFQQRLMMRLVSTRVIDIKRKYHTCLKKFNIETDDPTKLAKDVENVFDVELVDMSKEFLSFLTPEQAVKIDRFKDYFLYYCVKDLINKVEEHIIKKEDKRKVFSYLKKVINNYCFKNECHICEGLLLSVKSYPKLAEYVFSLFPHSYKIQRMQSAATSEIAIPNSDTNKTSNNEDLQIDEQNHSIVTPCEQSTTMADYEADHSSSSEDEIGQQGNDNTGQDVETCIIKMEAMSPQREEPMETNNFEVTKEEFLIDDSDISMEITIGEEIVKTEVPDWKREEDKLILEVLKDNITPQERKDKTVLEIADDKNIMQLISKSLPEKSEADIKDRMILILQMLVFSENKS